MERLTVNLTERASVALRESAEMAESNRTAVVNKALNLYSFLLSIEMQGGEIFIVPRPGEGRERLRVF